MARKSRLLRFPASTDRILTGYAEENDLTINEAAVVAVGLLRVRPPNDRSESAKRAWNGEKTKVGQELERSVVPTLAVADDTNGSGGGDGSSTVETAVAAADPAVEPVRCTHPRPWRKKLGYLTLCDPEQGGCGRPVTP